MKHACIQHHIADAHGIFFVDRDTLLDELGNRLAADKTFWVRFCRESIFTILDVENALQASGQLFKISVFKGRLNVHMFFFTHLILLVANPNRVKTRVG